MNLGGLTTLARFEPGNLVHVVFDNESLLSVGGFPTATSTGTHLEGSRGPRVSRRSAQCRTIAEFTAAFESAMPTQALTCIVAKVEAIGPKGYVTDLVLLENRFEFKRYIEKRKLK